MRAMVLAAGLGTRLRPLTYEKPKPAMPLLGKPLVVRVVEKLVAFGVDAVRINLHHLPEVIERIFSKPPYDGLPVSFSYEPEILGTAGGLKANEYFFRDETLLMVNGKIVLELSLEDALAYHRQHKALATLLLFPQAAPYRYTPIRIDREGRLREFKEIWPGGEPTEEAFVFTGIHIVEPEIFRFIPPGRCYEINDKVYPQAMREGHTVLGFPVPGYWHDPSTPSRYLEAQQGLMSFTGSEPPVYVAPRARVAPSARIGPFAGVESGCVIEADACVENAILWENVRLKPGAVVRNCVVGAGVVLDGEHESKVITVHGEAALV